MTDTQAKEPSDLAKRLVAVLLEAGRKRAGGMISKSGPMISFEEWVQRQLDNERKAKP